MKNHIKIFEQVGQAWAFVCLVFSITGLVFFYAFAIGFDFLDYLLGSVCLRIAVFSYWILKYRILVRFPEGNHFESEKYLTLSDELFTVGKNSHKKNIFWEDVTTVSLIRKYFWGYSIILIELTTIDDEVFLFEESIESFFFLTSKIAKHFPQVSEDFFEKFSTKTSLPEKELVFVKV